MIMHGFQNGACSPIKGKKESKECENAEEAIKPDVNEVVNSNKSNGTKETKLSGEIQN